MSEPSEKEEEPVQAGPVFRVLLVFAIGLLPGLAAGDAWVGWKTRGETDQSGSDYYLPDQHLGWVPRPHFENPKLGTRLDSLGMRSAEIPADAPPDEVRILACGASRLYGAGNVQNEKVWNVLLQERLDREFPGRVRVLNSAVMAYSIVQSSRRVMGLVDIVEPDLVFISAAPSAQMLLDPSSARRFVYVDDELVAIDVIEGWPEWLHSPVVALHKLLLHSNLYTRYRAKFRLENVDRSESARWWVLGHGPYSPDVESMLERTYAELAQLRTVTDERGIQLRMMVMPDYYQDSEQRWTGFLGKVQGHGVPPVGTPRLQGVQMLKAQARELGIQAWDFTPELDIVGSDNPRYLMDVGHWSPAGHAIIADGLYRRLVEDGLLDELISARSENPRRKH